MKRIILSISTAGIRITLSEFIRNEILFKDYWVNHFHAIGLQFETLPINGFLWMIWSFCLAYIIFKLLQKFSFKEAIILAWMPVFVMMWIVIYNLQTLPLNLLIFAVPLSFLEVYIAAAIIQKIL